MMSTKYEEDNADDNADVEEGETTNHKASTKPVQASHAASNLVKAAAQHMGLPSADGAALTITTVHQTNPEDAFRLLAATSTKANLDTQELENQKSLIRDDTAHFGPSRMERTDRSYRLSVGCWGLPSPEIHQPEYLPA